MCRQFGISHSHWLGGKRRWTEVDRAKALAYERWLADRCPKCGTAQEDWFDDDGMPLIEPNYQATIVHCVGCGDVARTSAAIEESDHGHYVTMKPFGDPVEQVLTATEDDV